MRNVVTSNTVGAPLMQARYRRMRLTEKLVRRGRGRKEYIKTFAGQPLVSERKLQNRNVARGEKLTGT